MGVFLSADRIEFTLVSDAFCLPVKALGAAEIYDPVMPALYEQHRDMVPAHQRNGLGLSSVIVFREKLIQEDPDGFRLILSEAVRSAEPDEPRDRILADLFRQLAVDLGEFFRYRGFIDREDEGADAFHLGTVVDVLQFGDLFAVRTLYLHDLPSLGRVRNITCAAGKSNRPYSA